jgi:hypothetical protein
VPAEPQAAKLHELLANCIEQYYGSHDKFKEPNTYRPRISKNKTESSRNGPVWPRIKKMSKKSCISEAKDLENRSDKDCCCGGHNASNAKKNKHHHGTAIRIARRKARQIKNQIKEV